MNYLVIHRGSNFILTLASTSKPLQSSATLKAIRVGDRTLDHYYRLKSKADVAGTLVDAGALAKLSANFSELLAQG